MNRVAHAPHVEDRPDSGQAPAGQGGGLAGLLWLTWRQHRWALVGSLVVAAALTAWMLYLAADMTSIYHQCHSTRCPPGSVQESELEARFGPVKVANNLLQSLQYLPLLTGIFLGVPLLAREHEQRTLLLAWSQDVSPVRWLWSKIALLGLAVAALTAVLAVASDHLSHAMSDVTGGGLFDGGMFFDSGMLPLALGVAWFAVGVALGAAIRRLLPAVLGVIVGSVALMLLVEWRYPTLMTPLSRYQTLGQPIAGGGNNLRIGGGIQIGPGAHMNLFDSSEHPLSYSGLKKICPDLSPDGLTSCMLRKHLKTFVRYQPASRIPEFHLILATAYLGIGVLALAAVWAMVRRTSLSAG